CRQSGAKVCRALCAVVLWIGHPELYVRRPVGVCHQGAERSGRHGLCVVGDPGAVGVFHDRRRTGQRQHEPDLWFCRAVADRNGLCALESGPRVVVAAAGGADGDCCSLSWRRSVLVTDRDTIDVYDARAAEYADMTDYHNGDDPRLMHFITACPAGGTVLDLGCGPGASALVMAKAGLVVEATDASAEMVALAEQHAGVTARQGTFDDLTEEAAYDGIWANFSLLHAPRADFPRYLAAIHRALKPRGAFMIGMKLGNGEARDGIGRFYTYYSEEELDTQLTSTGFTLIDRAH
ncbi:unnamed protein product, partial [Ectocarpus sp. 12 AP-2014]